MNPVVVLEWNYSPANYFEERLSIVCHGQVMVIGDGKAEATIDAAIYDGNPGMRETLHGALNDRFLGVEVLSHKPYELSALRVLRRNPDGREEVYLEAQAGDCIAFTETIDIQITDKDGTVIADSKRDRLERRRVFAEQISKHRSGDKTLASLLRSFHSAVRDPENELVHLYEIRDALAAKFGDETKARIALGIRSASWSRLGQLCNSAPLRQGRHRGKAGNTLRDATEAELNEARSIARLMVEAYTTGLDGLHRDGTP